MGYCDEAKVGRLNRSADMFVLAVIGTVDTTFFVILAGQAYDTGLG
jgi:hypothetical protein